VRKRLIIAIDGPSGVGKGTVARAIAAALRYRHVDTGAMYRGVAWRAVQDSIPFEDEAALGDLAERIAVDASDRTVTVDGIDITAAIRTPEIDRGASRVARVPRVRTALVEQQRALGAGGGVVMEGRDIGTVVFPNADVKVYLDASAEERARRRLNDAAHQGSRDMEQVATEMAARDRSDRTRSVAPLMAASDAHVIDTTGVAIDEVVGKVLAVVEGLGSQPDS
jgi:CMP/dCMP kinase